jgi:membrane protein required for colicin V production
MEPHTGLATLDYVVFTILLLSGVMAFFKGFVREMFALIAWTVAYWIAAKYYPLAEPVVHHYIKNQAAIPIIAGLAIFCVALVVLTLLGNIIADRVKGKALTAIDRSLGFIFGVVRGVLVVCIVYMAAVSILWPDTDKAPDDQDKDKKIAPEWVIEAKTHPAMAYGAAILKDFMPQKDIEKSTRDYETTAKKLVNQKTLDMLTTPKVSQSKETQEPSYDDNSRFKLDDLINQKGKE